jgi:hypothetical protein
MPRSCSIFIQSEVACRAARRALTLPARWIAPPYRRSFSVSVVFPASGWLIMAKVRRRRTSSAIAVILAARSRAVHVLSVAEYKGRAGNGERGMGNGERGTAGDRGQGTGDRGQGTGDRGQGQQAALHWYLVGARFIAPVSTGAPPGLGDVAASWGQTCVVCPPLPCPYVSKPRRGRPTWLPVASAAPDAGVSRPRHPSRCRGQPPAHASASSFGPAVFGCMQALLGRPSG